MTAPHFCNVDLDIESRSDLSPLEAELRRKVLVLTGGPFKPGCFLLSVETLAKYNNPDDTIAALCSLVEKLAAKGRRAWRLAFKKEFDVGFDAARSQFASQFSLRSDTLKRISDLGATLGVTFYYFPTNDFPASQQNKPSKPSPSKRSRGHK